MSDPATKTLKARCFCGAVHFTVDIPTPQLPLAVRLCHCSLCRYVTGAPFIVHTTLPSGVKPQFIAPSSDQNITNYAPAGSMCTFGFCSTCGCHINARDPTDDNLYVVSSSIFSEQRPDCFQIKLHIFSKSTKDDGFSPMLTRIGDREMRVWNPEDNDPRAKIVEAKVEVGEDGQGRLRAQCHCGGVSFMIKRPSKDVKGDEWLSRFVSPLDENKWRATLDICDDCRLVTGTHIIGWTFVPLQCCEPGIKADLKIGTAKTYVSSAGVLRSFCGTCGATVFYSHGDRQRADEQQVVDVATGIIRAPEGSMAQNWLTWRSRIAWTESGKRFDKDFTEALEEAKRGTGVKLYDQVHEECTNLKTLVLEAPADTNFTDGWRMTKSAFDKPEVLERELQIMRTLYNTFPSLKEVVIEIYSVGIKKDVRQRFLDHVFKVKYIKNESDDTQEWLYHPHESCNIYCPYDERDYEGGFDDNDDDDDDDDSSSITGNFCAVY